MHQIAYAPDDSRRYAHEQNQIINMGDCICYCRYCTLYSSTHVSLVQIRF
jgi:hypothetical protein